MELAMVILSRAFCHHGGNLALSDISIGVCLDAGSCSITRGYFHVNDGRVFVALFRRDIVSSSNLLPQRIEV